MKKYFAKSGTDIKVLKISEDSFNERLAPKVYSIKFDPFSGFYLTELRDRYVIPPLYGRQENPEVRAQKIVNTFEDREKGTGALMTGTKGSGKTLLAQVVSNMMIDRGYPAIEINEAYKGSNFIDFITDIGTGVFLVDEFTKKFSGKSDDDDDDENGGDLQSQFLSMLDGTASYKRLFLFTENSKYYINSYLLNRPGRIYYSFEYKSMESDVIIDYCKSNGVNESIAKQIVTVSNRIEDFNFDILKAIVEEYKRYGDSTSTVEEITKDLNIEYMNNDRIKFVTEKIYDLDEGKVYEVIDDNPTVFSESMKYYYGGIRLKTTIDEVRAIKDIKREELEKLLRLMNIETSNLCLNDKKPRYKRYMDLLVKVGRFGSDGMFIHESLLNKSSSQGGSDDSSKEAEMKGDILNENLFSFMGIDLSEDLLLLDNDFALVSPESSNFNLVIKYKVMKQKAKSMGNVDFSFF